MREKTNIGSLGIPPRHLSVKNETKQSKHVVICFVKVIFSIYFLPVALCYNGQVHILLIWEFNEMDRTSCCWGNDKRAQYMIIDSKKIQEPHF